MTAVAAAVLTAATIARTQVSHIPERAGVLTWTGTRTFRECRLRFARRYVQRLPERVGPELERGSAVHAVLEQIGRAAHEGTPLSDEQVETLIAEQTATLHPEAAQDARELLARYIERGGPPGFPSDAENVGFEVPFAIDRDGRPAEWDAPAMFRSVWDVVYRENGGSLAVVRDYKTNWVIEDPGEQMRIYAWAACCLWPEVEEVVVELHFVRYGAVRRAVLAREQSASVLAELRVVHAEVVDAANGEGAIEERFPPRVSTACLTCSFVESCPAMRREVPLATPIADDADAVRAARELVRLRVEAKRVEEQLAAWAGDHGPVDLGDETFGPVAKEKKSAIAAIAADVLMERGVTTEQVWEAVSLPSAELNKLVTKAIASAPKKEKAAARERVLQAIDVAGGFERRTDVEMRFAKKKAEVLDAE
jgi:hypothetical protein